MFERIKEKIKIALTPYFILFYVFLVIAWNFRESIFDFFKLIFK
ncbi:MAG TPA: hypothetical protein VLL98_02830 [Rickettsiales bacterium]|nr:hypothetical protein [Rickettsiales bacterium]